MPMTQDEFEKMRERLEEQLRVDVEMLYEAHRVKLRAFETIARAHAELHGEEAPAPPARGRRRSVLTLPAAPAAPEPPARTRGKAGAVFDAVQAVFDQLPEEFDKNDLHRALGFVPNRPTLFRALELLQEEGVAIAKPGLGRIPTRFRKLP